MFLCLGYVKGFPNVRLCQRVLVCSCFFFIKNFLYLDLGSTVSLCYLGSLRKIEQIQNYDWGGMAHATLMHFMTQLSRQSLSSLGGAPFVWQVRFGIYCGYI